VICAEGYVFELERRGYLQAGAFVPEVVLEHPEVVTQLHRDFVHAGSDVVEALTYYAHREKLRVIGASRISSRSTAARSRSRRRSRRRPARSSPATSATPTSTIRGSRVAQGRARDVRGAGRLGVDAGVDFIVGETFSWAQEALIALDVIQGGRRPR
jgi:betaine-homocysteine S-methyltransferase